LAGEFPEAFFVQRPQNIVGAMASCCGQRGNGGRREGGQVERGR
jgi:hypothetical protein